MKKSILHVIAVLVCLVMMVGMVAACAQQPAEEPAAEQPAAEAPAAEEPAAEEPAAEEPAAEEVTIVYSAVSADDMFVKAFNAYAADKPHLKLEVQMVDVTNANSILLAQVETGTLADVTWWQQMHWASALDVGGALDLTPYIDQSKFADGAFLMGTTEDGKISAFPCEMQIQGFLINTQMFADYGLEIPETFDELLVCAETFAADGKYLFGNGSGDTWPTWGWFHWFQLWGEDELADQLYIDQTLKFSESDVATAYEKMIELREAGAFMETNATVTYEMTKAMFLNGECASMTTSTDWLTGVTGSELDNSGAIEYWFGVTFPDSPYDQNTCIKMCGNGYGIRPDIEQEKLDVLLDFFNNFFYTQAGADIALEGALVLPIKDYTPGGEVTPLTQSILDLTLNTTRRGHITADYAALNRVGNNTDIWLAEGTRKGEIVNGCINGSITKDTLDEELAEFDEIIAQMVTDYQAIEG